MSKKTAFILLLIILIFSTLLATVFFAPRDMVSPAPVYNDDFSMHYAQCISAKRFLAGFGHLWGYDPFFLAGFPQGVLHPDIIAWQLFYYAASPVLGPGPAFKVYLLLFFLLYPLCIYGAMRNFSLSRVAALVAALLSVFLFNLTLAVNFFYWGVVSYVIVCFFSLYVLSLFFKLFNQFTWKQYFITAGLASLLFLMHVLAYMHLVVPLLILYIVSGRRLTAAQYVAVFCLPLIVVGSNLFWFGLVLEFYRYKTAIPQNYEFTLQIKNLFEFVMVYVVQRRTIPHCAPILNNTFFDCIMLLFGSAGVYQWFRNRHMSLAVPFAGGVFFIFLVIYFGSHTPFFAQFQPQRFIISLDLLLLIPASCAIVSFFRVLFLRGKRLWVFFVMCFAFVVLVRPILQPFAHYYKGNLYRLNCTFPQQLNDLLQVLEDKTTTEGRILLEDSEYTPESPEHQYYGGHIPALFPELVRREYLCGPRPMYPIKHSYASYTRGLLFEKDISAYSLEELKEKFDLFNVKWIVSWYEPSKKVFDRYPDYIAKRADVDKFSIYEVQRKPSYFLKGSGRVHADYNRIELSHIVPENGEIIIAYHYMEKLKAQPPATIVPAFLGGDPVGFIKIRNPGPSLTIINGY